MNINFTLFAQAIVFTAFIWFTVKFVWPPLLRAIEARQKQIADGLAAAEQGKKSLEVSSKQADQAIQEARGRAADIIAQAEKRDAQMVEGLGNCWSESGGQPSKQRPLQHPNYCQYWQELCDWIGLRRCWIGKL